MSRTARPGRSVACVLVLALLFSGCSTGSQPVTPNPPPDRIVVSLTFSDGHVDQYDNARPVLLAHHMPATFYVVSSWADQGDACCMAWWQIDNLYRDGNEIGGMGRDHEDLTAPPNGPWPQELARRRAQVCDDRRRLVMRGYDPRTFAYPAGAFATVFPDGSRPQDLVRECGYLAGRAVGGSTPPGTPIDTLPPADPFVVRTPQINGTGPVQLADLVAAVRAADRAGGWVPIAFDRVCRRGTLDYDDCMASPRPVEDTTLAAFLDFLASAGKPGGAPQGTGVKTVRAALGAPDQPPLPPRTTVVSLTFDDAHPSQYLVRPILLDHNMRATFYANSGLVDRGDDSEMTWDQLRALAADGNDVGGHTLTHADLSRLNLADQEHEICADRDRLLAQGLNAVSFAYPFGALDADAERIIRSCGYRSARSGGGANFSGPTYSETIPPANPYSTLAIDESHGPLQVEFLESAVEAAASHGGGWVQIVLHMVCRASTPDFNQCMSTEAPIELGVFIEFVEWLETRAPPGTEVRTVAEVIGRE
jgi:peptidoglycan/xylan/chitin deacetylase (PgdA/CDA1 family)